MLHLRTILPHTLELLRQLQKLPSVQDTRLVGGTALALQYGHRQSVDLDFFGTLPEDIEQMEEELRSVGKVDVLKDSANIRIYQINNVKVDFVNYSRYPWIDNIVIEDDILLASPKDIAAMKVNAVEGRGTKKDFIDIYALLHHYSLNEILAFYDAKYPEHSTLRAIMSLTYYDDADEQMSPTTFDLPSWEEMKEYIRQAVESWERK